MSRPSPMHRLRTSRVLGWVFALTGLCWVLGVNACALHDLRLDECEYATGIQHVADLDEPVHVPCCPHALNTFLPSFQAHEPNHEFVATTSTPIAAPSHRYRSYSQSPPTPPPIPR